MTLTNETVEAAQGEKNTQVSEEDQRIDDAVTRLENSVAKLEDYLSIVLLPIEDTPSDTVPELREMKVPLAEEMQKLNFRLIHERSLLERIIDRLQL